MKRKFKLFIKIKYIIMIMTIVMLGTIVITYNLGYRLSDYKNLLSSMISPVRESISYVKGYFHDVEQKNTEKEELLNRCESLEAENQELKDKLDSYSSSVYELNELRDLLSLSDTLEDYPTVGATVIAKKSGNWFYEFTIDKGSDDGIEVDMNVCARGGLAGIVTDVGKNYSIVTSIIADDMNVSAVTSGQRENCIVSGDLELLADGYIRMMYISSKADIGDYERIITSTTSSKYLPGILIGYAYNVKLDSSELTKSGYLIPAVDFEHMEHVIVIKTTKTSMISK